MIAKFTYRCRYSSRENGPRFPSELAGWHLPPGRRYLSIADEKYRVEIVCPSLLFNTALAPDRGVDGLDGIGSSADTISKGCAPVAVPTSHAPDDIGVP
ncbi:hypothetical protein A5686_00095 [Mycobacterium sp. E2479]|nr:hypothetical protein A5686_00095 [Mycobacterium sp. E2479]